MSTFRFISGVMSSSKTTNLLNQIYDLRKRGEKILLVKPSIDTRTTSNTVSSRIAGIAQLADHIITPKCDIKQIPFISSAKFLFVDEAQFLTVKQVEQLRELTCENKMDVFCYGLLLTSQSKMFEASKRLFELCDEYSENFKLCERCSEKAKWHLRLVNGEVVKGGPEIEIENGVVTYESVCYKCFDDAYKNQ